MTVHGQGSDGDSPAGRLEGGGAGAAGCSLAEFAANTVWALYRSEVQQGKLEAEEEAS